MTGASSLAFPGSRKLASWWRQLAPYQPQALWVAHLLVHHVEALVRLSQLRPVDPLTLFLLQAVALADLDPGGGVAGVGDTLDHLQQLLRLGRQVLRQTLRTLETDGLVHAAASAHWCLTALGRQALDCRQYPRTHHERRVFYFVEAPTRDQENDRSLHFLDVHNSTGIAWPVAADSRFDVRTLQDCVGRPEEWKQRHGFPVDVQEILGAEPASGLGGPTPLLPPTWQRVIVDRPEWILTVLIQTAGTGRGQLTGLAVRQEGWILEAGEPLFTMGTDWPEIFPELVREPSAEAWRRAWRSWCEPRAIPADEAEACTLERQEGRVRVAAPLRLMERLRATRSDALKGETWLLAGEDRVRTAALVEVVESGHRG